MCRKLPSKLNRIAAFCLAVLLCFTSCGAPAVPAQSPAESLSQSQSEPAPSSSEESSSSQSESSSASASESSASSQSEESSSSQSESGSSSAESSSSASESGSSSAESSASASESSSASASETASAAEESSSASESQPVEAPPPAALRDSTPVIYSTAAKGAVVYGNSYADIDASSTNKGYICVRYLGGSSKRIKVLITKGGTTYQYNLNNNGYYEVFPLSAGSGSYNVGIYEQISGSSYSQLYVTDISVSLDNNLAPFLRPNQYVNYYSGSAAVSIGQQLASTAASDLQVVQNVYNYVINNITYDYAKASSVTSGYLPRVDNIIASGLGICFDYAAVMASMLRSQGIPTKLVVGYSGSIYHAWISTYITDVGWVNGIIYFDGTNWKRMDPTFADNGNQSADIMNYIENGANYSAMYYY